MITTMKNCFWRLCLGVLSFGPMVGAENKVETAEAAWGQLIGDAAAKHPAYAYVENRPELPNVFIYGDSISIGYTAGVRMRLASQANVYRLHQNGGDSGSFAAKFAKLETTMRDTRLAGAWEFQWNVIHFNVGLHDLKFVDAKGKLNLEGGTQVASIETYAQNLRKIIGLLKVAAPEAKLIFALTTHVPPDSAGRIEGSETAYNAAARRVLADFPEIEINDLQKASRPYMQVGNVHFKPDGIQAQAEHVAAFIASRLPAMTP